MKHFAKRFQSTIQRGVLEAKERNVNSDRSKCIMAGLGRYELTLLEKQFAGRAEEYIQKNGMITEQQAVL